MRWIVFALLISARVASAGWEDYRAWVVADATPSRGGIRVTYLGVNGYRLECAGHELLVDPYFSRAGLAKFIFNERVEPDLARITAGLKGGRSRVDAVLVTHAHVDHLLDVPPIMQRTGAMLIAGPTAVNLARAVGRPPEQCCAVQDREKVEIGPWKIRAVKSVHDRLFGEVRIPGDRKEPGPRPVRAKDWVLGEPLGFFIEAAGHRIYIDAGGRLDAPVPTRHVDLAILGVALPDARRRLPAAARALTPRYVVPSHQDDFFHSMDHGFVFGMLTDFPGVLRLWKREKLPGQIILLDYFRPWTLR